MIILSFTPNNFIKNADNMDIVFLSAWMRERVHPIAEMWLGFEII